MCEKNILKVFASQCHKRKDDDTLQLWIAVETVRGLGVKLVCCSDLGLRVWLIVNKHLPCSTLFTKVL